MDALMSADLSVPAYQLAILVIVVVFSLLLAKPKLGLIVTFLFVMYWGYWTNLKTMAGSPIQLDTFTLSYFGFGVVITLIALLGFFHRPA
ncbi:MAG: hypothetical protein P8165_07270 [Deltaproteobacteria bacterium]|jgi:hypothetical protein